MRRFAHDIPSVFLFPSVFPLTVSLSVPHKPKQTPAAARDSRPDQPTPGEFPSWITWLLPRHKVQLRWKARVRFKVQERFTSVFVFGYMKGKCLIYNVGSTCVWFPCKHRPSGKRKARLWGRSACKKPRLSVDGGTLLSKDKPTSFVFICEAQTWMWRHADRTAHPKPVGSNAHQR